MCPTMSDDGRRCLGDIGQQDTKLSFEICPLPLSRSRARPVQMLPDVCRCQQMLAEAESSSQ